MMKRTSLLFVSVLGGLLVVSTSCNRSEIERLQNENAKLQSDIVKSDSVQIQFMNAYAEIEENLREIKIREKLINENAQDAELNPDMQQRIISDIVEIGKLMDNNRKKLQSMESLRRQLIQARKENNALKKENQILKEANPFALASIEEEHTSEIDALHQENQRLEDLNASLEKSIELLKKQLKESEIRLENLQEELTSLREAYATLERVKDSLEISNQRYLASIEQKNARIADLESKIGLNPVYYIVANNRTLKDKRILLKKDINPNMNYRNLTTVERPEELDVIETKSSKVEILSTHPSNSYEINKKDKKNLKIVIKNPQEFWKTSRVCIIQTK